MPDRSRQILLGFVAPTLLVVGSCASSGQKPLEAPTGSSASLVEETEPEVTSAEPAAAAQPVQVEEPVPEPMVSETPVEAEPVTEASDRSVVMIETGAKDVTDRPKTLAEVARAERERRQMAAPTDVVITDKTLAEYATGQLTIASSPAARAADEAELAALEAERAKNEAHWRGRAREIRQAWRDAYDQIEALEQKVFELRQAFFREDDGFYRDAEIKPAWDRAIDQLEAAHLEVEARQRELADFLEEGREAGALPGWLREGIDLEPPAIVPRETTAEPGEPVIYRPESTDPP